MLDIVCMIFVRHIAFICENEMYETSTVSQNGIIDNTEKRVNIYIYINSTEK